MKLTDRKIERMFPAGAAGLVFALALVCSHAAIALDANANSGNGGVNGVSHASMDDVARMIRRNKNWEILDARSRQNGDETRYRFKLINSTGKVKIIQVDPRSPSLKKLDQ